jgi:hypothetical protein
MSVEQAFAVLFGMIDPFKKQRFGVGALGGFVVGLGHDLRMATKD